MILELSAVKGGCLQCFALPFIFPNKGLVILSSVYADVHFWQNVIRVTSIEIQSKSAKEFRNISFSGSGVQARLMGPEIVK